MKRIGREDGDEAEVSSRFRRVPCRLHRRGVGAFVRARPAGGFLEAFESLSLAFRHLAPFQTEDF